MELFPKQTVALFRAAFAHSAPRQSLLGQYVPVGLSIYPADEVATWPSPEIIDHKGCAVIPRDPEGAKNSLELSTDDLTVFGVAIMMASEKTVGLPCSQVKSSPCPQPRSGARTEDGWGFRMRAILRIGHSMIQ